MIGQLIQTLCKTSDGQLSSIISARFHRNPSGSSAEDSVVFGFFYVFFFFLSISHTGFRMIIHINYSSLTKVIYVNFGLNLFKWMTDACDQNSSS